MQIEAVKPPVVPGRRDFDRSFGRDACQSPRGAALVRPCAFQDSAKASVCCPRAQAGIHEPASDAAIRGASSNKNRSLFRTPRRLCPRFIPLVIQHQFNRRRQAFETFLAGLALAVGFRHFRTEGDEPFSVALNHCGVAVSHGRTIPCSVSFGNLLTHLALSSYA